MKENKLWSGRFEQSVSEITEKISESISYDRNLYKQDITASLAHAQALHSSGLISKDELISIKDGLTKIQGEIESGSFVFSSKLEDIHMHIENRLTQLASSAGKKLHTGRSRNDQVAVDTHLYVKEAISEQKKYLHEFLTTIVNLAESYKGKLWAGYTHTQIAQPIYLSHYLLSWFWQFSRDVRMLNFALSEADVSPLGAGALAGPGYAISREESAKILGFTEIYANSLDAVANRDYQLSYHFFAMRMALHASRLCEDLILYSTAEFGYVKMSDAVTTGSSMMPQKKNPDIAELLRGKTGRITGNFMSLAVNLKGLPMTYNRDLQEDKVYLFDNVEQVSLVISGLHEILKNTTFYPDRVTENLRKGFSQATDVADYLVIQYNVPFRTAHDMAGKLVKFCEEKQIYLDQVSEKQVSSVLGKEYLLPQELFDLHKSPERKPATGSTSSASVEAQIKSARDLLAKECF